MPADEEACRFDPPVARLPGLHVAAMCPQRDVVALDWLFAVADYLPGHLPDCGGSLDQTAWLMDAAELANASALAFLQKQAAKNGAGH